MDWKLEINKTLMKKKAVGLKLQPVTKPPECNSGILFPPVQPRNCKANELPENADVVQGRSNEIPQPKK